MLSKRYPSGDAVLMSTSSSISFVAIEARIFDMENRRHHFPQILKRKRRKVNPSTFCRTFKRSADEIELEFPGSSTSVIPFLLKCDGSPSACTHLVYCSCLIDYYRPPVSLGYQIIYRASIPRCYIVAPGLGNENTKWVKHLRPNHACFCMPGSAQPPLDIP